MISALQILVTVLVLLWVFRGGVRSGAPLWRPGRPLSLEDPIRLLLFVILILLLIGFMVRTAMPLGDRARTQSWRGPLPVGLTL